MRRLLALTLLGLCVLSGRAALAFDCNTLDFGAKLSDLDDGNFVLYKQENGVSYYNYVGSCRLPIHDIASPAVAYAFVDGRYYARLIRVIDRAKDAIIKNMQAGLGSPIKISERGDWSEFDSRLPRDVVFKFKYNRRTGEALAALYSKPLREQLAKSLAADPVDLKK